MLRNVAKLHSGGCAILSRRSNEGPLEAIGSAFICHSQGYALTSAHSINLTDKLFIVPSLPINQFNPSHLEQVHAISVSVAQYDAANDVALLKMHDVTVTLPADVFGEDDQAPVGASLCYLGFPYAHQGQHALKVSGSVLSAKIISPLGTKQIQFDAMVEAGHSGGPLIDVSTGKIIGIISGRFSPTGNTGGIRIGNHPLGTESTISYATAISHAKQLMRSEGLDE